jgi:hypothetical protein
MHRLQTRSQVSTRLRPGIILLLFPDCNTDCVVSIESSKQPRTAFRFTQI